VSQRPRLSTEACDLAEEAFDFWLRCIADGQITPEECDGMTTRLAGTVAVVSEVDESIAETVATLRCGPDSARVTRLRTERRLRNERAA
jgi:hypothetical protein